MAAKKDETKSNIPPIDPEQVDPKDDDKSDPDMNESTNPRAEILFAMSDVARGGSMTELRRLVVKHLPTGDKETEDFVKEWTRFRQVSEAVQNLVLEAAGGRKRF